MTTWFDKDRQRWRYSFWRNKVRYAEYCIHPDTGQHARNKRQADDIEALIKAEVIRDGVAAQIRKPSHTLAEAVELYSTFAKKSKDWGTLAHHLEILLGYFGHDKALDSFTAVEIERFKDDMFGKPTSVYKGGPRKIEDDAARAAAIVPNSTGRTRSMTTVRRYLETLRTVCNTAAGRGKYGDPKNKMMDDPPKIVFPKKTKRKSKPLAIQKLAKVINDSEAHVRETALGCLYTGFRLREMLRCPASFLDEDRRGLNLDPNNKDNEEDFVPLSDEAFQFFQRCKRRAEAVGIDRLILWHDHVRKLWRPIDSIATSWRKTLARHGLLGITNFHRATKATLLSMISKEVSISAAQLAGRHEDPTTTMIHYTGVEEEERRETSAITTGKLAKAGIDRTAVVGAHEAPTEYPKRWKRGPSRTRKSHTPEKGSPEPLQAAE
jgi:hypothetical protein